MPLVQLRAKRQLTLPVDISREMGLNVGDWLEIVRDGDALVLRPKQVVDRAAGGNPSLADMIGEGQGSYSSAAEADAFIDAGRDE